MLQIGSFTSFLLNVRAILMYFIAIAIALNILVTTLKVVVHCIMYCFADDV